MLSCATGALVGVAAPAFAQSGGIDEIVITAEKREASIQDVPVAVSAYTARTREQLGVLNVDDLARVTPSVTYTNNDRLSIRGVGRRTNAIGTDPSVALYSDGVFSNSMADAGTPPLFIERTEVLRGPQGTLYGRNSIGGALNIISRRPSDEFETEMRATVGNLDSASLFVRHSGPVSDSFRYALGAGYEYRGEGYIENISPGRDVGDADRIFYDAQFEADLTENLTARVSLRKAIWDDTSGNGNTLYADLSPIDNFAPVTGTIPVYYNPSYGYAGQNQQFLDPFQVNYNQTVNAALSDHIRINADVTWDQDSYTVRYLGGYQEYSYFTNALQGDLDLTPRIGVQNIPIAVGTPTLPGILPAIGAAGSAATAVGDSYTAIGSSMDGRVLYGESQSWYSNEINISSNLDGPVQWIAGVYQYHQTYEQPTGAAFTGDTSLLTPFDLQSLAETAAGLALGPGFAAANPAGLVSYNGGYLEVDSYATFGQVDWDITDEFRFTFGLRYTWDSKNGYDDSRTVGRSPLTTQLASLLTNDAIPYAVGQGMAWDLTTFAVCSSLSYDDLSASYVGPLAPFAPFVAGCDPNDVEQLADGGLRRHLDADYEAATGTAGVQWTPTDDTNTYFRYSRGYKSGGWLGGSGLVPGPYADSEYVDAYEIGLKQNIGAALQVNTAAFMNYYEGFQTPNAQLNTLGSTVTNFLNFDAEAYGVEVETLWAPIENLQFMFNYAYLHTELTGGPNVLDNADPNGVAAGAQLVNPLCVSNCLQSIEGNQLPLSPEHKATLGITYTIPTPIGNLTASALYTYVDASQSSIFQNGVYTAPSYEQADFRVLFTEPDDAFTVVGFVRNAFDETIITSSTGSTPIAVIGARRSVTLGLPRTFGVEMQYRF